MGHRSPVQKEERPSCGRHVDCLSASVLIKGTPWRTVACGFPHAACSAGEPCSSMALPSQGTTSTNELVFLLQVEFLRFPISLESLNFPMSTSRFSSNSRHCAPCPEACSLPCCNYGHAYRWPFSVKCARPVQARALGRHLYFVRLLQV